MVHLPRMQGPGLIGADDRDGQLGTGFLGADLDELEHLQRLIRGVLVQVDPSHPVQDVREQLVIAAGPGELQRSPEVVARRVNQTGVEPGLAREVVST